jgi:hypothetical protein
MSCLVKLYNERQGHITKLYIHNLCLQLGEPSPYKNEFEFSFVDKRRTSNKKEKKSWVGDLEWI